LAVSVAAQAVVGLEVSAAAEILAVEAQAEVGEPGTIVFLLLTAHRSLLSASAQSYSAARECVKLLIRRRNIWVKQL
jgi:hypothetical protein